jgi:DNA-binding NarL/FixJ family response regulator
LHHQNQQNKTLKHALKMNKKLNVLLVDHSPAQEQGIHNLLNHYTDYVTVNRFKNGWDIITENVTAPDLVILYNNIPTPDGIELLVSIRMKHPKAKVVLFTRDPELYYRNMCELVGADYHYNRSLYLSVLPESIKAMILGYQIAA